MPSNKNSDFAFFRKPAGFFTTTLALWVVAYILASLAIDSGSILQWVAAIVAVVWGLVRLVQGLRLAVRKA
jgi:cytochrome c biogenesis protein CcdA